MKILTASTIALSVLGLANVAQAQPGGKLFFEGDIVRGAQQGAPGPFCVLTNQFKRLEKVVWRIRVLDQAGNSLDAKGLKSLVIELPDGQKLRCAFRPASAAVAGAGHRPFLDRGLDHPGRAIRPAPSPTR